MPIERESSTWRRCDWQSSVRNPNNQRDICRERRLIGGRNADGWFTVRLAYPSEHYMKTMFPKPIAYFHSREHAEDWLRQLTVEVAEPSDFADPSTFAVMD